MEREEQVQEAISFPFSRQIRLNVGDSLRLECPIWGSGPAHKGPTDPNAALFLDGTGAGEEDVMYQWNIRNIPDYSLAMNPRFRFSESGRVVQLTGPVTKEDAGVYHCSGVTGFGRKEVTFEVYVADSNVDLLCAKTDGHGNNPQNMLCFVDPNMRINKVTTVEALLGTSVDLNCEAMGAPPIKYLWFMGSSVADWISGGQDVRGPRLHIPKVGREHTGHYTCQVRNAAGTLNYTYRVTVKEPPSAIPTIIGGLKNQTLFSGGSGMLTCQVKCSCAEPIIQVSQVDTYLNTKMLCQTCLPETASILSCVICVAENFRCKA
ncbi:unnamed protein product [Dibothriocephalus latus]|uniref:Ig-like domain-containing protein n=1 Tax=Dibothriocephalus latus TaxID=60516 RepID=A0A3P7PVS4_DIBLA|nr:unnamed protein product [Dibothriocephalus latus]